MEWIAKQPYIKIQREVNSIEQKDVEQERFIYLYQDKVVTKRREFPLPDVLDMSYREIAGEGGLLYLHTMAGVYSYTVKSSPGEFIEVFKEQRKNWYPM